MSYSRLTGIQSIGESKYLLKKYSTHLDCNKTLIEKFFYLSDLDFFISKKIICDLPQWKNIKILSKSYFNHISLINKKKILVCLNKCLTDDLKTQLFEIILATKNSEKILLAGSNAATILNKCGFSWKNRNLQGVQIPHADFSNNLLININFESSNLREADFSGSHLNFVNFKNCEMQQTNFGNSNYLKIWDIKSLYLSPNQKILATIIEDGHQWILWSLETHTLIRKFPWHSEKINSIHFSPCGLYVCSLHTTKIRLWKISDKKLIKKIFLKDEEFNEAVFTPCSKYLVATSACNLYAWDLQKLAEPIFHFACNTNISTFALSKSGKLISIMSNDYLEVRSIWQNKPILTNKGKEWIAITMDFSPSDKYICWYGYSSSVNLWDLQKNEIVKDFGYACGLMKVCFSSCEQFIIGGDWYDRIIIWEIESKMPVREIRKDWNISNECWFSFSGKTLAYLYSDGVKFLEVNKIKPPPPNFCLHSYAGFSPCGNYFASGGNDEAIKVWQIYPFELKANLKSQSDAICLSFSPCGNNIASACSNGLIRVWDISKNEIISILDNTFDMGSSEICALSYTMSSDHLVSIENKMLTVWKVKKSQKIVSENLRQDCYTTLKLSPLKTYFAYGCKEKDIEVLWTKNGREYARFKGHESAILAIDFSPNEDLLISSSEDEFVIVWDLKQKRQIKKFRVHDGVVTCLCCSSCGNYLATGGQDCMIKIWNLKSLDLMSEIKAHSSEVNSISISPNGDYLVSGGFDNTVKLWNFEALIKG